METSESMSAKMCPMTELIAAEASACSLALSIDVEPTRSYNPIIKTP